MYVTIFSFQILKKFVNIKYRKHIKCFLIVKNDFMFKIFFV